MAVNSGGNIPFMANSTYSFDNTNVDMFIAQQNYSPTSTPANNSYWLWVIDLLTLDVVISEATTPSTVPADVADYVGNPQFFLVASAVACQIYQVPQGDLYTLFSKLGAGPLLSQLEQVNEQSNSTIIDVYSYVFAAVMDPSANLFFEASGLTNQSIMTLQFMPNSEGGGFTPVEIES